MEHDHHHEHEHKEGESETEALLHYMVHHNEAHAKELQDLLPALEKEGNAESVEHLRSAIALFLKGNNELDEALALLQKGHH